MQRALFITSIIPRNACFFNVLEEYQKSTIQDLIFVMKQAQNIGVDQFTIPFQSIPRRKTVIYMTIITNREFQYLTHKVPRERIAEHHSLDERLLTKEIFFPT